MRVHLSELALLMLEAHWSLVCIFNRAFAHFMDVLVPFY